MPIAVHTRQQADEGTRDRKRLERQADERHAGDGISGVETLCLDPSMAREHAVIRSQVDLPSIGKLQATDATHAPRNCAICGVDSTDRATVEARGRRTRLYL